MMSTTPDITSFTTLDTDAGERLDRVLHRHNPQTSRTRFKDLIKQGFVQSGGRTITEPNHRVKSGDAIAVEMPAPLPALPRGENINLDIVFEDDQVIVINKPAGLVVHPGAGNWTGTLVNALITHCGTSLSGIGGVARPGIVHRLDKDTSGLLVVAKTDRAHHALSDQFAAHGRDGRLERSYLALIWGRPQLHKGSITTQIARKATDRKKMAVVATRGKQAITHYQIVSSHPSGDNPRLSLVKCRLETGRTHQIRVHMAHMGHPVICDEVYGAGFKASINTLPDKAQSALVQIEHQALHATILGFQHPASGEQLRFESPMPGKFSALMMACNS